MVGWNGLDGWMTGWMNVTIHFHDRCGTTSLRFRNHRSKYISVNRSSIRYGFNVGVKDIRFCVNIALTLVVQTYTADRYFR